MAIYEYRCEKCGRQFEAMQAMGSEPLQVCGEDCVAEPKDGKGRVERIFSVANILGSAAMHAEPPPGCGQCDNFDPSRCH